MNILVTGVNGQLGNEMRVLSAENQQHTYFFTDVQELDICDEQAIRAFVTDNRVDVIVNCAAYTAVDKAEDNPELCDKLNHIAPGYLAAAAEACGAAMIQVSTDYVFDGTGHIPLYGRSHSLPQLRLRLHKTGRRAGCYGEVQPCDGYPYGMVIFHLRQ